MACAPPNSFIDGRCLQPCPSGYEPVDKEYCRQLCPEGFFASDESCIRPVVMRNNVPPIVCPPGAERVYDQCLLACPEQCDAQFELCIPRCPPGFVQTLDGQSCVSELISRTATLRSACFQGETRSGPFCLRPCPAGTVQYLNDASVCYRTMPPEFAPYFITYDATAAKVTFQRNITSTVCPEGYSSQDGRCYAPCGPNSTANNGVCYLSCPPGYPPLADTVGCVRPVVPRLIVASRVSVLSGYLRTFAIVVGIFIGFNLIRRFAGRS
jgi:hypothetical protein